MVCTDDGGRRMSQRKTLLDKTRELEEKFLTSTFLAPVMGEVAVRISGLT